MMQAWIARDGDGEPKFFRKEPTWHDATECWVGCWLVFFTDSQLEEMANSLGLQPGYCQPITLTATPTGEAKGWKVMKEPCKTCEGEGTLWGFEGYQPIRKKCPRCNGSGDEPVKTRAEKHHWRKTKTINNGRLA